MEQDTTLPSAVELLRKDFRLLYNEVRELRRLLEGLEENNCEFLSVPKFAKLIGLSSERIRQLCETGRIKAVQPAKDRGRWKILGTELKRFRTEAQSNHFNDQKNRRRL